MLQCMFYAITIILACVLLCTGVFKVFKLAVFAYFFVLFVLCIFAVTFFTVSYSSRQTDHMLLSNYHDFAPYWKFSIV